MPVQNRTFRVFVSSTFSDLVAERDALQRIVFPRLRALCERRGARFQAIDLRWGISEEASLDQRTVTICLEEIARCQRITPRPNLIVLLGDRYGWEPLPEQVPAAEFEAIQAQMAGPEMRALFAGWYRRDDNAVPPCYLLRPREGAYADWSTWHALVEVPLLRAIRQAVLGLDLPRHTRAKYEASATHQEIQRGALLGDAVSQQVFVFFRSISNLEELTAALPDPRARALVDSDSGGRFDAAAHQRLIDLKDALSCQLPGQLFEYSERWVGDGLTSEGIGMLPETQEACEALLVEETAPRTLCEAVWQRLGRTILAECAARQATDPLEVDVEAHQAFGIERARNFVGRRQAREAIATYLARGGAHALGVWGAPGSGKSALLARAADEARRDFGSAVVITRFIGATPESTDVRTLLAGLCRQVSDAFGADAQGIPSAYRDLVALFTRLLGLATEARPLILFLDALDQLSEIQGAAGLDWLPSELPEHIRVVVSTLPGRSLCSLQARLPTGSLVELKAMSAQEGADILDLWLAQAERTLQPLQRTLVLDRFGQCGLPLYLRLAFEECSNWHSFDGLPDLAADIPGLSSHLFDRLSDEAVHGEVLVSRSLGFILAGKNGLGEDEILDLLSSDKEVMADFCRRSPLSPRVDRLPVAVWSRLFLDLEPYLGQRSADGTTLLGFFHRELGEAASRRFFAGEAALRRHEQMAAYFGQQSLWLDWRGVRLPNLRKLSEQPFQESMAGLWDAVSQTLTSLLFVEAKCVAGMAYELLADYEQVMQLRSATPAGGEGEADRAAQAARYVRDLAAFARGELVSVQAPSQVPLWSPEQFRTETAHLESSQAPLDRLKAFASFVQSELHNLVEHGRLPGFCLQQAYNSARGGPVAGASEALLLGQGRPQVLIQQSELRPPFHPYPSQSMTLEGHSARVTCVDISADGARAVSGSEDRTLRVWDLFSGHCVRTLEGHQNTIACTSLTPDGAWAVSGSVRQRARDQCEQGNLRLWDVESGLCAVVLDAGEEGVSRVAVSADGTRAASVGIGGMVQTWDLRRGALLRSLALPDYGLGDRSKVSITANVKWLLSAGSDGGAELWDLEKGVRLAMFMPARPRAQGSDEECGACLGLALTPDGRRAVLAWDDGALELWDLSSVATGRQAGASCLGCIETPAGVVAESMAVRVSVTPDGVRVITTSQFPALYAWDFRVGGCIRVMFGQAAAEEDVAISPDGACAVSCSDTTVRAWDIRRGSPQDLLPNRHGATVLGLYRSAGARRALSYAPGSSDCAGLDDLRVWDGGSMRNTGVLEPAGRGRLGDKPALAGMKGGSGWEVPPCNPALVDARALAVVELPAGKRELWTWDLETCKRVAHSAFEGAWICPSADGRMLVTGTGNLAPTPWGVLPGTIKLWDLQKAKALHSVPVPSTDHLRAVDVCRSGRWALIGGSDNALYLWDLQSGTSMCTICLEYSLQAQEDIETGKRVARMGDGAVDGVLAARLSPDARLGLTGSWDHVARLWNLETGQCVARLEGHASFVDHVAISPDGRSAASVDGENHLRLWDLRSGSCVAAPPGRLRDGQGVCFTPDARGAQWIAEDGSLWLWDLDAGEPAAVFRPAAAVTASAPMDADGRILVGNILGEVSAVACPAFAGRPPVATAVRAWLVDESGGKLFGPSRMLVTKWDDWLRAQCPWCGGLSTVPEDCLLRIDQIHRAASLDPVSATSLDLAGEAWQDPGLLTTCSLCGRALRLNPFVVDGPKRPAGYAVPSGQAERRAGQRAAQHFRAEAARLAATGNRHGAQVLLEQAVRAQSEPNQERDLAKLLHRRAREELDTGDPEVALVLAQEAESLCHESGLGLGVVLWAKGNAHEQLGDWARAFPLYREAARWAVLQPDKNLQAHSLFGQGRALELKNDLDGALAFYREAERIFVKTGDTAGVKEVERYSDRLRRLAVQQAVAVARGQRVAPIEAPLLDPLLALQETERRCRESGDKDGLQRALWEQAYLLHGRGESTAAMPLYQEQETLCRELGEKLGLEHALWGQASILHSRGQADTALPKYREQEALCRELGNKVDLQVCLRNQAQLLADRQEWDAVLVMVAERATLCRALDDQPALHHCLLQKQQALEQKAVALANAGSTEIALPLFREQEALCRVLGDKQSLGVCLGNLVLILEGLGDRETAIDLLKERQSLCRELNNAEGLHATLDRLERMLEQQAIALYSSGESAAALSVLREQEAACRELGNKNYLENCLRNLAVLLEARRDWDAALPLLRERQALCRELGNDESLRHCLERLTVVLEEKAVALHNAGNLEAALPLYRELEAACREIGRKNRLQICLGNQALICEARGEVDATLSLLREQEMLCRELGNEQPLRDSMEWRQQVLETRAVTLHNAGDPGAVLLLYREQEALCRELGAKDALRVCLGNQTLALEAQGELEAALALLREHIALCREEGLEGELCAALEREIALLGKQQASDASRAPALEELVRLYRSLGNADGLARSLARQAYALGRSGRTAEALARVEEAYRLAVAANRLDLAGRIQKVAAEIRAWADSSS